jgi:hypothetical protein
VNQLEGQAGEITMKASQTIRWVAVGLILGTGSLFAAESSPSSPPPYPPSPVVKSITFAPKSEIVSIGYGDNWSLTWADDDCIYAAFDDGWGFAPRTIKKLSVGYTKITGTPPDIRGENIPSPTGDHYGDGAAGMKASGMLMVDGVLYMWLRNVVKNSQIAWSDDHARTWQYGLKLTTSFGCPTFLNFGKNYEGARDDYVYVYSQDGPNAYDIFDGVVLARVLKTKIRERAAYQFFAGLDEQGRPRWTDDIQKRLPTFVFPNHSQRLDVAYDPGIKRYLMGIGYNHKGGWGLYDAPEPWGPWTTVFHTERWDCGETFYYRVPTKWIRKDGKELYLFFCAIGGDRRYYSFSVRKVTFDLK